ncbi:Crp/Fnr family transcriptional regulator [Mariniflexile ostreae]|uniref:Crp/Fnr family transcriptional regulator n=1 Tax=Mariniflexile ostreae TaxID=1520892 RepID=A0ABV5FBC2_9FLAO
METELLQKNFSHIFDTKLITAISEVGILKNFKKDDIIIDINQYLTHIPLLVSGHVKILREDENGYDLLIYFLEVGDTCTMSLSCCAESSKSKIRAIAEKDSSLIMIPVNNMQEWFNTNETWRGFILNTYQKRFSEMLDTIDTLAFLKMDERLLKFLIDKTILHDSKTIFVKHQEIAEDLHTSRVVISRLLKQLENQNKIKLSRNKIEVL